MLYNNAMKIGIYGGTFDPIHNGHISIAKSIRRELGLDIVYFTVAADPPHKSSSERTPGNIRLSMVRAALEGEEGMAASDIELRRDGVSYTVETLHAFKRQYENAELYFIVGEDMLENFPTWYRPGEILSLATLAAAHRPHGSDNMEQVAERIEAEFGGRVLITDVCGPDVSSTDIRNRVFNALPIFGMVPYAAEIIIFERQLYVPQEISAIGAALAKVLDEYRLEHTMLVVREAELLARKYRLDVKKARIAALLHDCAKLNGQQMIEYADARGFELTDEERLYPFLIHARLGAEIARSEYGIEDTEILNAIRRHTLGSEDMTDFDKIIYLADKLEPSRNYRKLGSLRELAYRDMDAAVVAVMRHAINYTKSSGRRVHPMTVRAIEALENKGTL
ncbi:MAG: nicotinate-nucleotide adenylyltransferase [Christensenellaceae bacterium]|nr:nicotinate-nucleotide adenylyltransferase [Christensenellaceae bacterium]